MSEEFRAADFNIRIGYVLEAQGVGVPIIMDQADCGIQFFIHVLYVCFLLFRLPAIGSYFECPCASPPGGENLSRSGLCQWYKHCASQRNRRSASKKEAGVPGA